MMEESNLTKLVMYEMVFPSQTNHYGTLFGGEALSLMDKATFIVASRFTRNVVTTSSEKADFRHPIKNGHLVEIVAEVTEVGNTSLKVTVDIIGEDLRTGDHVVTWTTGKFSMVALDDFGKPASIKNAL